MRIGFVTARLRADWHAARLARALAAVGDLERVDPGALRVVCGRDAGRDRLLVADRRGDARRFDAVLLGRVAGAPVDEDLQLDALRALERLGVPVVNPVGALLAARDKLWTSVLLAQAGLPTPLCSSVPRASEARAALRDVGEAAGKPVFGSLGEGLFRVPARGGAARLGREAARAPVVLQRFVPPGGTDFRLFVAGDRVEACVRRSAPPGEWRSNAARGSVVVEAVARRPWAELAVEAARALGLLFAGVDLALDEGRPTVLEVNGFPSFRAVHAATGRDMAGPIARQVALAGRRAPPRSRVRGPGGPRATAAAALGRPRA